MVSSGKGRGSAMVLALVIVCMVALHGEVVHAATYSVGGPMGWTFNVDSWPRGKRFKAGDVIVFNYSPSAHNVVQVNRAGYNSCSAPREARAFRTGKDHIKLAKGQNFFICSFPGHCQGGMKIAITAV